MIVSVPFIPIQNVLKGVDSSIATVNNSLCLPFNQAPTQTEEICSTVNNNPCSSQQEQTGGTMASSSQEDTLLVPQSKRRNTSCDTQQEKNDEVTWEEIDHPRKVASPLRSFKTVSCISLGALHHVFMNNPRVSRKATTDEYIKLNLGKLADFIQPLLNNDLETLDLSELKGQKHSEELYNLFESKYVPLMDERVKSFLNVSFKSVDDAISS